MTVLDGQDIWLDVKLMEKRTLFLVKTLFLGNSRTKGVTAISHSLWMDMIAR